VKAELNTYQKIGPLVEDIIAAFNFFDHITVPHIGQAIRSADLCCKKKVF
jgi:hypothetical protein